MVNHKVPIDTAFGKTTEHFDNAMDNILCFTMESPSPPPQGCPCHCLTYDLSVSTFVSSLVRHLNLHHLSSCCALHQCLESASLAFWLLAFFLDGDKKQHW
mmetsp:Transcript_15780/g.28446  ORF Transcript_15780/g.28446 Transcript_15780/m.28446 type:complete len:101 (-) Transcript_15780:224-526(-)